MCIYIYIYIYVQLFIYMYIYIPGALRALGAMYGEPQAPPYTSPQAI